MVENMKFEDSIKDLKKLGNHLVPYNFPLSGKLNEDDALQPLKLIEVTVDGYEVVVHYNKSDYNEFYTETLQVFGKYCPFLPFYLVCKIARFCLGNKHLSFIDVIKEDKKFYCWTLNTKLSGKAIPNKNLGEICIFEGFRYGHIHPSQVKFI